MKPKFETRAELLEWIRTKTGGGLQDAQALLEFVEQNSLTLRDEFAAQLLSGCAIQCGAGCEGYMKQRAEDAYEFADAMLAARQK